MFSFYSVILDLIKARTHKYVRRIPVGVTHTGATKYRYFYLGQEGHGQGIAHESELVEGASFAFGTGEDRYHAHIKKIENGKITVEYDDGAKAGKQETFSKQDFQKLVHGEHKEAIKTAHEKSKAQAARVQQMKEGGAKVQQKTLDKWNTQVNKLKDIADLFDKPAEIDAPWMSEREKRVFEGQNRLFQMLENKELTLELLKDHTLRTIVSDMFRNVVTAIFKYKDLSKITDDKRSMLALFTRLVFSNDVIPNEYYYNLVEPISTLWQNLPFTQETKDTQVKRLHVIQADTEANEPTNIDDKKIQIDAIAKAQNALIKIDSDLSKIIYGNIIFMQIQKTIGREASGFYAPGVSLQEKQHITTKLETVHHSADVIYMDTLTQYDTQKMEDLLPHDARQKLKMKQYEDVATHELAHRFTRSIIEQGNTEFIKDISDFLNKFSKGASGIRDMNSIVNRPVKEFTIASAANTTILNEILNATRYNAATQEFTGFIRSSTNSPLGRQTVKMHDINFEALGDTIIEADDQDGIYSLLVPLLNGNKLKVITKHLSTRQIYSAFNRSMSNLPTAYASKNDQEMFSEMMSAVCNPEYKDEPMKTEFLALLKKHKGSFGA